jgi:uncharacterized protein YbjT (DUF2867 family)
MTTSNQTVLVLGATGGIGGAVAQVLHARGWRIKALNRNAEQAARKQPAYAWTQGDAMKLVRQWLEARGQYFLEMPRTNSAK